MRSGTTAKIGTRVLTTTAGYDNAGRLTTLTDPLNRAYGAQYDANGARTSLSYPNNEATTYTYDQRGRLTSLITKQPGSNGSIAQSYTYGLDATGKRTRIEESDGTIRQYGYDSVDRLTSEAVTGPVPYSNAFGYDSVGNRLTETSTGNHAGTVNYSYDQRDQLTAENATAYSYDNNGNLTAKIGEAGYTWDFENRLTRVALLDGTTVDHVYDADGNRVKTTVTPPSGTATVTNYLVDTAGNLSQVVAETDGTGALKALYVRADNELLAVLRPTTATTWATRYVHSDGLGSVRVLTDEAGTVTDTRDYEAFGVRNETTGNDPLAFGFAGEPFDSLAKLAYHRARWMDPRVGRFFSTDPAAGFAGDPLSLHRYMYANADPVNSLDPTGQNTLANVGAGIAGGAILATIANVGYNMWKDHESGEGVTTITAVNLHSVAGLAAAASHAGIVEMTSVATMVANVQQEAKRKKLVRLNIADHGNPEGMKIGDDWIYPATFVQYESSLEQLRGLFAPGGFVLLERCEVAQTISLVQRFAKAVGVPVYAYTGRTMPFFKTHGPGQFVRCEPTGTCT